MLNIKSVSAAVYPEVSTLEHRIDCCVLTIRASLQTSVLHAS